VSGISSNLEPASKVINYPSNNNSTALIHISNLQQHLPRHLNNNTTAIMQFIVASALFAAAIAAPAPVSQTSSENINISDYFLRKNNGIQAVDFTLQGNNGTVKCAIGATPSLPSEVVACGDSKYRFGLIKPTAAYSDAGLAVYHEYGPA
jgi:hypothetical protein